MTNYRVDAYDRIAARLKAAVEAERFVVTCHLCDAKYDVSNWAYCPFCAVRAFPRPTVMP